jgi:ubiquinone/menaquinone biosynthesis C-methylase UbiE
MHLQGWRVTGLDISPSVVERIQSDLGLDALSGTLPHPSLEPESFDVVSMWMSLEHMHQPREVLEETRRLLVPGGKVLVAVHNVESAAFRWFGSAWSCLDLPRHLVHFSPATLSRMLEMAGFRVERTQMLRKSDWMRASARQICGAGGGSRCHRWLKRRWPSRLAASYCVWTRRSDGMLVTAVKPGPRPRSGSQS